MVAAGRHCEGRGGGGGDAEREEEGEETPGGVGGEEEEEGGGERHISAGHAGAGRGGDGRKEVGGESGGAAHGEGLAVEGPVGGLVGLTGRRFVGFGLGFGLWTGRGLHPKGLAHARGAAN